ncbi:hypothetical protein CK203_044278 [Vitis vinifera]|uniref:Endonuclease/exonuclease/phosphatase domain-containing protein n=1 Tax=Vitis vinifera TaxID=29760 RepID=A0A438GVE5_VITVI|nr:hypothetical protein CK203_044278 [Vitis vinifera]
MEEIQWARIRVKITGETRSSMLEIEVEEEFYSLVLWWEIRPVVRRLLSAVEIRRRTEDRGDALSCAEKRVRSVLLDTGIEGQFLPVDGWLLHENGSGLESRSQTHGSRIGEGGGLAKRDGSLGRKLKDKLKMVVVPEAGPSSTCWASGMGCLSSAVMDGLEREGPKDVQEKAGLLGCSLSRKRPFPEDVLTCWVPEESRREQRVDGLSTTDCALQEEAKRELEEELGGDKSTWLTVYEGSVGASGIQASENVKGELWEECSLAKFSQVLGFSTEGIEKEIVSFLTKIRKRREKIHKSSLTGQREPIDSCPMKLKIISWNVRGANDSSKRKIIKNYIRSQRVDLMCIQETKIQEMSEGIVRSLGTERFLDWRALNAEGAAGGILICWDKRVLDILEWEEGHFTLSCRFKIMENGATWVFTGVYGPFTKMEREGMWEELGALRGFGTIPGVLVGTYPVPTRKE